MEDNDVGSNGGEVGREERGGGMSGVSSRVVHMYPFYLSGKYPFVG